ncbi:unnamed protein product [Lactuca saligna]|uniref:GRF-type domain-containing protein n=1 Tax=Lactuca saligna TaxID=75948 RepID=A0AA35YVE8_LACSI|nr:unnamed protein product [Lactuca saligna]
MLPPPLRTPPTPDRRKSSQKSKLDFANPCDCGYPSRIWTSTTKDNPGKEFRVCPNSTDNPEIKCKFWEWVNEEDTVNKKKRDEVRAQSCEVRAQSCEVRIAIMDHDFNIYKKKTDEEFDKIIRKISSLKTYVIVLFMLFVVSLLRA